MIITRAPYRVTLAGGGTDLPAFYEKHGGAVTSMALDKYIFVSFKKNLLEDHVRLHYLKTEVVDNINKLSHDRAREALRSFGILNQCEISSTGDLPGRSGLGSSGSYLVALINCLNEHQKAGMSRHEIASMACRIEMEDLREPVGKQDQFIAAYGGIRTFSIDRMGNVEVEDLRLTEEDVGLFTERCRIYYTGNQRSASNILKSQTDNKANFDDQMRQIQNLSWRFVEALKMRNFDEYGQLLHQHWTYKKKLSSKMTNPFIDGIYSHLKENKLILGGKIIGAGGGGFLMVYAPQEFDKVDKYMEAHDMVRLDYSPDKEGVQTLYKGGL